MVRLVYLVIDGVADRVSDGRTSLELAYKPSLDFLASRGVCGGMFTVGEGVAPESDVAVFSILGYDVEGVYTGRGPIEAVGAGLTFRGGFEVAFRANFATVDPDTLRIIDRRVGRSLSTGEARGLARAVDGIELCVDGCYARVVATVGHRAVVVIGCEGRVLSNYVENTDPAYVRRGKISVAVKDYEPYVRRSKPLSITPEARLTAKLVNDFTVKAIEILDKHPINKERERRGLLKGNAILLRDAGASLPKVRPINELFGVKFGAIAEMPVEIGIARVLGMEVANVPPPTPNKEQDYALRLEKTLELLKRVDVVYVHLKGPDEPAHDGNVEGKVRAIEDIDKYFVGPLLNKVDLNEVAILVTSDHATPPSVKAHTDDPVPIALVAPGVKPDPVKVFTERECLSKGALGFLRHGYELLPKVIKAVFSGEPIVRG